LGFRYREFTPLGSKANHSLQQRTIFSLAQYVRSPNLIGYLTLSPEKDMEGYGIAIGIAHVYYIVGLR